MKKKTLIEKQALDREKGDPMSDSRQNTRWEEIVQECKHDWKPVSMVFETQLLDNEGRVRIRQPDLTSGRCYLICMKCCGHTYINTGWVGYFLNSPDIVEEK